MADTETPAYNDSSSLETLETPDDASSSGAIEQANDTLEPTSDATPQAPPPPPDKKPGLGSRLRKRINIYLLLFIFLILIAVIIILIAYQQSRHSSTTTKFNTQNLSQSALQQLANGDVTVSNSQSILNVQSSAVFAGQVLIRQNLQVAGNLQIGGTVALNNIAVAGASQLSQATVSKDLSVAGDTDIQGTTTIAKSLQVNGNGTFSGALSAPQLTTGSLQLNGDLTLTHHIIAGGTAPSRSGGSALGSGGSVSIGGSDTAGSVSINTGSSPVAGCLVTVSFAAAYSSTPHVLITPIGSAAGGLSYYVNRSSTSFSICVDTPAPASSSFGFDYFVVD